METVEYSNLVEHVIELERTIDRALKLIKKEPENKYASPETDEIALALSLAQGSYKTLGTDIQGANERYASLQLVLSCVTEALKANQLSFNQNTRMIEEGSGGVLLESFLRHGSGQWLSSKIRVPFSNVDKDNGRSLSFWEAQQAKALLGIHANETLFDNGDHQAEQALISDIIQSHKKSDKNDATWERITPEQYELITKELKGLPEIAKDIYIQYGITTLRDMPKGNFAGDYKRVLEIKHKLQQGAL